MKHLEERHYFADNKKVFVRKSDGYRMGRDLYLAEIDSIEKYKEVDQTEEEIAKYSEIDSKENEKRIA